MLSCAPSFLRTLYLCQLKLQDGVPAKREARDKGGTRQPNLASCEKNKKDHLSAAALSQAAFFAATTFSAAALAAPVAMYLAMNLRQKPENRIF